MIQIPTRRALLGAAAAATLLPRAAWADTVTDIKKKGVITIGIQGDNAPWGFVNTAGVVDGFDADVGKLFAALPGREGRVFAARGRQPHPGADDRAGGRAVRHHGDAAGPCEGPCSTASPTSPTSSA